MVVAKCLSGIAQAIAGMDLKRSDLEQGDETMLCCRVAVDIPLCHFD